MEKLFYQFLKYFLKGLFSLLISFSLNAESLFLDGQKAVDLGKHLSFLEDKEGFGGVEGIHFTSFVLQ